MEIFLSLPYNICFKHMSGELALYKQRWDLANVASRGILEVSLDKQEILGFNPAAEALFGLPEHQSVARILAMGFLYTNLLVSDGASPIDLLRETGKPQHGAAKDINGATYFVEASPLVGMDGTTPTALVVLQSGYESAMRKLNKLLLESTLDIKKILDVILDSMGEIPHKASSIMLTQDHVAQVVRSQGWGDMAGFVSGLQISLDAPHFQHMEENGKTLIIDDVRNQKGWAPTPELDSLGIVNHLSGPIMGRPDAEGKRKCHGFLFLGSDKVGHFTERHAQKLQDMLDIIGPTFDNARIYSEIKKLSVRDGLTGLYNRRYMEEFLTLQFAHAIRNSGPLSAIMIDLDDFKKINDTLGHAAGDHVLREIAILLNTCVRNGDVVCRYGGEEFALILPSATTVQASEIAKRIQEKLKEARLIFESTPISMTMSMGIAAYPKQANDELSLIVQADTALYNAKHDGKNRIMVSGEEIQVQ